MDKKTYTLAQARKIIEKAKASEAPSKYKESSEYTRLMKIEKEKMMGIGGHKPRMTIEQAKKKYKGDPIALEKFMKLVEKAGFEVCFYCNGTGKIDPIENPPYQCDECDGEGYIIS